MQSPKRRTAALTLLRALEFLAWTAFFAFAAVFLALRFWLLPQIERYQCEVGAALRRAAGVAAGGAGGGRGEHARARPAPSLAHHRRPAPQRAARRGRRALGGRDFARGERRRGRRPARRLGLRAAA